MCRVARWLWDLTVDMVVVYILIMIEIYKVYISQS